MTVLLYFSHPLQVLLNKFNPAFTVFITAALAINFVLCIIVFFDFVILAGKEDNELFNASLYLGNGVQYLFR